jgi:hypothetical protein
VPELDPLPLREPPLSSLVAGGEAGAVEVVEGVVVAVGIGFGFAAGFGLGFAAAFRFAAAAFAFAAAAFAFAACAAAGAVRTGGGARLPAEGSASTPGVNDRLAIAFATRPTAMATSRPVTASSMVVTRGRICDHGSATQVKRR